MNIQNTKTAIDACIDPDDVLRVLEEDRLRVIIPECCREGWESCPHVTKRDDRPKRRNVGL